MGSLPTNDAVPEEAGLQLGTLYQPGRGKRGCSGATLHEMAFEQGVSNLLWGSYIAHFLRVR